jgi:hypothetical protein
MPNDDLKNKIIQKIHQEKQYSYWRFWVTDFLRILTIIILLIGSGLSLAYFVWDSLVANRLANFEGLNIWLILTRGLPEILLIVIVVSVILYLLYRQTDLPFVKNRSLVFGSVWLILVVLATLSIVLVQNSNSFEQYFSKTQESLEGLPYRPRRFQDLYREGRQATQFKGRVRSIKIIDSLKSEVTVQNPFETNKYLLSNSLIAEIKPGDTVLIEMDIQNPSIVLEIRKVPPRPFELFTRPEIESVILFNHSV